MNWVSKLYNKLPKDQEAYAASANFGIAANTGGIVSGLVQLNPFRTFSPVLSLTGDFAAKWVTRVQNQISEGAENVSGFATWAACHPLTVRYVPKITGTGLLITSGFMQGKPGEATAGSIYLLTNTLASINKKPGLLASSALSGLAAASLMINGGYEAIHPLLDGFQLSDIIPSLSGLGNLASGFCAGSIAMLNSRIEPEYFNILKQQSNKKLNR